jgi:hypothetical protein
MAEKKLERAAETAISALQGALLDGGAVPEKATSKASKKWDEKNNITAKTYKIDKDLVSGFTAACESRGQTQGEAISELMTAYINGVQLHTQPCWFCRLFKRKKK